MASPDEMAAYYDGHPVEPPKPSTPEQKAAYKTAVADFEDAKGPPPTPSTPSPPSPPGGGAGFPAARLGDQCMHGGTIVMGSATVMIGNKPAARVGDNHVCPMVTVLVPHVGGPIAMGSTTVMIDFMPAARVLDQAVCTGPPDMIAMGDTTVFIG